MSELVSGPLNHSMLRDVVEQLRRSPVGLDPMLGKMIPCGVAFHHAGAFLFSILSLLLQVFMHGSLLLVQCITSLTGIKLCKSSLLRY